MPGASTHNAILRDAARRHLRTIGLIQKGRSRGWLDDHSWWIINVEFQPSGFAKASYLNVGVQWLWKTFPAHSFDAGSRVGEFVRFDSVPQFEAEADRLAAIAAERVIAYRQRFPSVEAVVRYYVGQAGGTAGPLGGRSTRIAESLPWADRFHAAVAFGLTGRATEAARWFRSYIAVDDGRAWVAADRAEARKLLAYLPDTSAFRNAIKDNITNMRGKIGLPELTDPMHNVPAV